METLDALHAINDSDTVWIYQASRRLNATEQEELLNAGRAFCANWATHGKPLEASVLLIDGLFVIVKVNSALMAASGCSIDKSLQWIRSLEQQFTISLLDRMQVAWMDANGQIHHAGLNEAKNEHANGVLNADCRVFNHTITSGLDLKNAWLQPLSQSWLLRFLN